MDPLRREVMAPRTRSSFRGAGGLLGPLFVLGSTLALTMAMAALALTPHPRRHHHGRPIPRAHAAPRVAPIPLTRDPRCSAPVYHAHSDGSYDATYELCAR